MGSSESRIAEILSTFGFHYDPGAASHREKMKRALELPLPRKSKRFSGAPFVRFLINYIREQFDTNDDGSQVAYFELLSGIGDGEIRDILRLFTKRSRWPEYPDFPMVLNQVRDGEAPPLRLKRPKRGRFDDLFVWRLTTFKFVPNAGYLANSLSVENLRDSTTPHNLYRTVVRFRKLRQEDRYKAARTFLRIREGK